MRSKLVIAASLLVIGANSALAQAYNGGGSTGASGLWTMSDVYSEAQAFTLSSAINFDNIRFWHAQTYGGPSSATFDFSIYSGAAFAPTTTYVSGSVTGSNITYFGNNGYQNFFRTDLGVGQSSLSAGSYFLELHSNDGVGTYWANTSDGLNSGVPCLFTQSTENVTCYPAEPPLSMQLMQEGPLPPETSAPEPAAIALMATGLLGVFGVTRRRR